MSSTLVQERAGAVPVHGPAAAMALPRPVLAIAVSVVLVLGAIGAALTNSYYLLLMTFAAVYVLAGMGLNLLTGYTSIVSIAHGALVCVGAYATAIPMVRYGWGFWPAALLSTFVGMGFATLLALPALRLSSWYYVLITIAFTMAVTAMLNDLRGFTGGYGGMVGVGKPALGGLKLDGVGLFALVSLCIALLWWLMHNLVHSRIGWALQSIREGDVRARALGVSTARLRLFAFAFSGAVAGLAGATVDCLVCDQSVPVYVLLYLAAGNSPSVQVRSIDEFRLESAFPAGNSEYPGDGGCRPFPLSGIV